jgi:hypothetical protein
VADWTGLLAALRPIPELAHAACKGKAPLFDGGPGIDPRIPAAVCRHCLVFAECLRWVAGQPSDYVTGIVAGRRFVFAGHESMRRRPDGHVIESTALP